MTWLKDKELCLGQGYTCKVHNKKELRLKGASKGINIKYKEGYLAMWLMIFHRIKASIILSNAHAYVVSNKNQAKF